MILRPQIFNCLELRLGSLSAGGRSLGLSQAIA
jgi:hypothetical protein